MFICRFSEQVQFNDGVNLVQVWVLLAAAAAICNAASSINFTRKDGAKDDKLWKGRSRKIEEFVGY